MVQELSPVTSLVVPDSPLCLRTSLEAALLCGRGETASLELAFPSLWKRGWARSEVPDGLERSCVLGATLEAERKG